jgi:methionyl-tRNA formyltransferase
MIPKSIRELAKYGAWGIHASLLPKYAGHAPLNWAMIYGEEKAGVTMFRMEDGVDNGDIISQKSFSIEYEDSIKEVYAKATTASKEILLNILSDIKNVRFAPQNKESIEIHPPRTPQDGEIDWNKSAVEIYNFIRAQTLPYPCAYSTINDRVIKIIDAKIVEKVKINDVLGKITSYKNKTVVTTKDGFIEINSILEEEKMHNFNKFVYENSLMGGGIQEHLKQKNSFFYSQTKQNPQKNYFFKLDNNSFYYKELFCA